LHFFRAHSYQARRRLEFDHQIPEFLVEQFLGSETGKIAAQTKSAKTVLNWSSQGCELDKNKLIPARIRHKYTESASHAEGAESPARWKCRTLHVSTNPLSTANKANISEVLAHQKFLNEIG